MISLRVVFLVVVREQRLAIARPPVGLENFGVGVGGEHHETAGTGSSFTAREGGESSDSELGVIEFQRRGGVGGAERESHHF